MNRLSLITSLFAAFIASISADNVHDRKYYEEKFFNWLSEHKKNPESGDRFVQMLQNFADNDDYITAHNSKATTYLLGHNQFSHMTFDEWRQFVRLGLDRPSADEKADFLHSGPKDLSTIPASVDWLLLLLFLLLSFYY